MVFTRFISLALFTACATAALSTGASAEPLDSADCKTLKAEQKSLLTSKLKAALSRGPDWVKENLHNADEIEKVRHYLLVEEKTAFRCRTDGVRVPKPKPMELPERKPEPLKALASAATNSFLPLRKPGWSSPAEGDTEPAQMAADASDTAASIEPIPAPSQTVADSDKTAPQQD